MTLVDRFRTITLLAMAGLVLDAGAARAQSAEAEALFRDGRKLIKAGKVADGCAKLAASESIESSIGTLLNLGDCQEKLGRTASAWAAFRKAEAQAKRAGDDDKRMVEARRRAQKLEPNLAKLMIDVRHPVDGMVVRRGNDPVDAAVFGTAVPVDPGTYKLTVEAPGHKPWTYSVTIAAKTRRDVVVPQLVTAVDLTVADLPPAPGPRIDVVPAPRASRTWTGTRKFAVGLAVAGVGAAAGGGIYFGVRARDLQDRADERCPTNQCNDPEGLRLNDEAKDSATRSNVFLIAGGAVVAVATVLWFVGAPEKEVMVAPAVGDGRVGVSLSRRF
jgi:hypothetical protein